MGKLFGQYYLQHRLKLGEMTLIGVPQLKTGMIIHCHYNPQGTKGWYKDATKKKYVFLILNPLYRKKVHAISLSEFPYIVFDEFAERTGLALIDDYKAKGIDKAGIRMDRTGKAFYYGTMKRELERKMDGSYRVLHWAAFNDIYVCNYKFSDKVVARWLPKLYLENKLKLTTDIEIREALQKQLTDMGNDKTQ